MIFVFSNSGTVWTGRSVRTVYFFYATLSSKTFGSS